MTNVKNLEKFLNDFRPKLNTYHNHLRFVEDFVAYKGTKYKNKTVFELLGIDFKEFIYEKAEEYEEDNSYLFIGMKDNKKYLIYGLYQEDYYYDSIDKIYTKIYIPLEAYEKFKAFDKPLFENLLHQLNAKNNEKSKLKHSIYSSEEVKKSHWTNSTLLVNIKKLIDENGIKLAESKKALTPKVKLHKEINTEESFKAMKEAQIATSVVHQEIKRLNKIFDTKSRFRKERAEAEARLKIEKPLFDIELKIKALESLIEALFKDK